MFVFPHRHPGYDILGRYTFGYLVEPKILTNLEETLDNQHLVSSMAGGIFNRPGGEA